MKFFFSKKIIFSFIFGFASITGLIIFSSIYYNKYPLPTVKQLKENDISIVFNNHFNQESKIVINKDPHYWWEIIGSESKKIKSFYKDLNEATNINFTDVIINYNNEPILNNINNNINIDLLMSIKDFNENWIYKGILNYEIKKIFN